MAAECPISIRQEIVGRCNEALQNIRQACIHADRDPAEVTLMAVTKTVPPEQVNAAVAAGIRVLGENRVQEYLSKKEDYDPDAEVQFIGHLQTNKVKQIVGNVTLIHSVDSLHLAQEISKQARIKQLVQPILLEVNIAGEASKSGVSPNALPDLLRDVLQLQELKICGLMVIPPPFTDPCTADRIFGEVNALYRKMQAIAPMDTLSMGMSGDYTAAIRHGSTMVRLGSALFGKRVYPPKP
ncbi:MAG: YggS family pyridoxal phosphate-dependent enzyme [Oscillospiraceae bacterium]|nr:YggS family pyridoxal phosphate-dependent enzyme [Oscillospiraceae bacterium]